MILRSLIHAFRSLEQYAIRIVRLGVLVLLILGSFSWSASADDEPSVKPSYRDEVNFARVVIYRERRDLGGMLTPTVMLGTNDFVDLPDGSYVSTLLKPGHYEFQMDDRASGAQFDLEAGDVAYMKVDIIPGFWKGGGRLTVMMPEQGSFEIRSLRRVDEVEEFHAQQITSNEERGRITKKRIVTIASNLIGPTAKVVAEARDSKELQAVLRKASSLPPITADEWGTEFKYVRAADGKEAFIVSAGADKVFDEATWREADSRLVSLGDDAVFRIHPQGGGFVRIWDLEDVAQKRNQ